METTIAVSRMLLCGVFDRHPTLKLFLAHSGGTLPFLAGRLESCIQHDAYLEKSGKLQNRRRVWDVLKTNIMLDAVVYSSVGLRAAVEAAGAERVFFGTCVLLDLIVLLDLTRSHLLNDQGTDHPFFPPLEQDEGGEPEWLSVTTNYKAIDAGFDGDGAKAAAVLGGNAVRLLNLA